MPSTSWSSVSVAPRVRARSPSTSRARRRRSVGASSLITRRQCSGRIGGGRDLEAGGRPAANRLLERFAHDLVERGLGPLAELVDQRDVERDRDPVLAAAGLHERVDRRREPVVAQGDRLEVEGEVAELSDRRPRAGQRAVEDLARLVGLAAADQVERCVEHQRHARERLHRAVVQEERDAPPLVLLRREHLLGRLAVRSGDRVALGVGRRLH